jgi:enoyl-CoA hydratase
MDHENFLLEVSQGVGLLRLNRPEKRNALTGEMVDALANLCREIERRDDIGVVILTGSGTAFCAGGDIDAWSSESPEAFGRHWVRDGHDAFDRLARLRQPVIAVLNGHALGGGLELAACADYRIAEAHIKIGQPEAGLGIIAGWSGTQRTVRRFGAQIVRRMAVLGEVLTAQDARAEGVVDEVVETGKGLDTAQEIGKRVLSRGPLATELSKMLVNAAEGEDVVRVLESLAGRIAAGSDELRKGLAAFRAKHPPNFRD